MRPTRTGRVTLQNANHAGSAVSADAGMYEAMKRALLKVLPGKAPGLTAAEAHERLVAHLPADLFPGGAKAGWWMKAVQLDLEAKGIISREATKPLRLHKR